MSTHLNASLLNTLRVEVATHQGVVTRITLSDGPYSIPPILSGWFEAYLHGESAPLPPLRWPNLSQFTQQILKAIAQIPFGHTTTYGQLHPAARAVGNACKNNPFPLLIPCHRVVAASHLGGYAFGTSLKQRLIDHERGIM